MVFYLIALKSQGRIAEIVTMCFVGSQKRYCHKILYFLNQQIKLQQSQKFVLNVKYHFKCQTYRTCSVICCWDFFVTTYLISRVQRLLPTCNCDPDDLLVPWGFSVSHFHCSHVWHPNPLNMQWWNGKNLHFFVFCTIYSGKMGLDVVLFAWGEALILEKAAKLQ